MQAALQDMCRNLLGNDSAQQDIETLADSMSLTTFSAATSSGPCIAALYLVQLGRQSWGWQDLGGMLLFLVFAYLYNLKSYHHPSPVRLQLLTSRCHA